MFDRKGLTLIEKEGSYFLRYQVPEEETVSRTELEMLKNNDIRHVLKISELQEDDSRVFLYNVTGKMRLLERFQMPFSGKELYQMLKSFCSLWESADEYMIDKRHFVLFPDVIYVDQKSSEIFVMVLPAGEGTEIEFFQIFWEIFRNVRIYYDEVMAEFPAKIQEFVQFHPQEAAKEYREFLDREYRQEQGVLKPVSETPAIPEIRQEEKKELLEEGQSKEFLQGRFHAVNDQLKLLENGAEAAGSGVLPGNMDSAAGTKKVKINEKNIVKTPGGTMEIPGVPSPQKPQKKKKEKPPKQSKTPKHPKEKPAKENKKEAVQIPGGKEAQEKEKKPGKKGLFGLFGGKQKEKEEEILVKKPEPLTPVEEKNKLQPGGNGMPVNPVPQMGGNGMLINPVPRTGRNGLPVNPAVQPGGNGVPFSAVPQGIWNPEGGTQTSRGVWDSNKQMSQGMDFVSPSGLWNMPQGGNNPSQSGIWDGKLHIVQENNIVLQPEPQDQKKQEVRPPEIQKEEHSDISAEIDLDATVLLEEVDLDATMLSDSGKAVPAPVLRSKETGEVVKITYSGFLVGRQRVDPRTGRAYQKKGEKKPDLSIAVNNVSHTHAMFTKKDGQWYVTDQTSLNGTYVNEEKLVPGKDTALKEGDIVRFADEEYEYKVITE